MIHQIFTIFDSKTEAYLPPMYFQTKGAAVRAMEDTLEDPNHQFCKHPGDFTLFHIGEFDDTTCTIDTFNTPKSVGVAQEFIRPKDFMPQIIEGKA